MIKFDLRTSVSADCTYRNTERKEVEKMVETRIKYFKEDNGKNVDGTSPLLVVLTHKELISNITATSLSLTKDDYSIFLAVGESLKPQRDVSTSASFVLTSAGNVRHCTIAVLPTTFSRHNSPGAFCFLRSFFLLQKVVNERKYIFVNFCNFHAICC